MRRLLAWGGILAILWGGYWAVAGWGIGFVIDRVVALQKTQGFEVSIAEQSGGGFPLRGQQIMKDFKISAPRRDMVLHVPAARLSAPLYAPGSGQLNLPKRVITFSSAGQVLGLALDKGGSGKIGFHLGTALELDNLHMASGPFRFMTDDNTAISGADLRFDMVQASDVSEQYNIAFNADALSPAAPLRAALRLPAEWPQAMEAATLQMQVTFDRPFDRTSRAGNRPQPRLIDIQDGHASWGGVAFRSSGRLEVNARGIPTGALKVSAKNWREGLAIAAGAGLINARARSQLEQLLGGVAQLTSGNRDALETEITFRNGDMFVGFIPIGRAPVIYLQ